MNKTHMTFFFLLLFIVGCKPFSGKTWDIKKTILDNEKSTSKEIVSSIDISNNQIVINGAGFSKVTIVKIQGSGVNESLIVSSLSDSQIIAKASSAFSLMVSGAFNLIIGTSEAQVTYPITFTLKDGAIQVLHLSQMGASTGQVLKWNGTSWMPASLVSSQRYLGSWNANAHTPDITLLGSFQNGDYYIVNVAGDYTSDAMAISPTSLAVGDWIIFNGTNWDKVDNNNGRVTGTGVNNYIPYFSNTSRLENSPIFTSAGNVEIGTRRVTARHTGLVDINGSLRSNSFILGEGPDLSLIAIRDGQSTITSWHAIQLVGNKQSTVEYTPSNTGALDSASVIIPNQIPTAIGLIVRGAASQSGSLIEWQNSAGTKLGSINASGSLVLGQSASAYKLDVDGDINLSGSFKIAGVDRCTSAGCTSSASDKSLKQNIKPLKNSLEKILKLEGVGFDWRDKNKYGKSRQIGFIAQSLEQVYPEVVSTDIKTGLKSVSYAYLVAPLVEAIRELNKGVESLKLDFQLKNNSNALHVYEKELERLESEIQVLKKENEMMKLKFEKIEKLFQ